MKIHNTLTRKKDEFIPIDSSDIRMYVCGPTVYNDAHIGNARPIIIFDILFRLLRYLYGDESVFYVRNITDVDDKITDRALREYPGMPIKKSIRELTEKAEDRFHHDVVALGCLRPTIEPRATNYIPEMRVMIERLEELGHAYVSGDHVFFDVSTTPSYGQFSGRTIDTAVVSNQITPKRNEQDFVLWKPSNENQPAWKSPCGIATSGRPGWHIECSVMAKNFLGSKFDIHGGGIDLMFPHHENEIAQSCCVSGFDTMANYWVHNGMLFIDGEVMSKSRGNFITIRDLLGGD